MSLCRDCGGMLDPGKMLCRRCGAITPNEIVGAVGSVSKAKTTTLDQVEASSVDRIVTGGPWDSAWGGGIVPTSITLMGGGPGLGKALNTGSVLPTPSGWTTMGDVEVGDTVFDERGRPCIVTATSPVMRDHDCYEVVFSDGEVIVADADHLWLTTTKLERKAALRQSEEHREYRRAARPSRSRGLRTRKAAGYNPNLARWSERRLRPDGTVQTTKEIASSLHYGEHLNHAIARAAPLILPDAKLPVGPYTLGVWLGDGFSTTGTYAKYDEELAERVRAEGYEVVRKQYGEGTPRWAVQGLTPRLQALGVLHNKHIPPVYLRASMAQRLELLRGLMDTDGTCMKTGSCQFDTTIPALRDGVQELLTTFGIRAVYAEKDGRNYGKCWRFTFMTERPVFTLPRKRALQGTPERDAEKQRYVADVRPVPSVPVRCIAVDSPSKLYLAGRGMIPTHNTTMLLQIASAVARITGKRAYYLSAEQAPGEIRITADRLGIDNLDRIRVLSSFGVGAEVDEELLKEDPPAMFVVDSVSAMVGKDAHAALLIAKRYKSYSAKYGAPSVLISHMTKQTDYAGLMSLQHEVDTLITLFANDEGIRELRAWKNRFGSTFADYPLLMTEHGLVAPPPAEPKKKEKGRAGRRAPAFFGETGAQSAALSGALTAPAALFASSRGDEISERGQRLVRLAKKASRAAAVEGEALKSKRAPMPREPARTAPRKKKRRPRADA